MMRHTSEGRILQENGNGLQRLYGRGGARGDCFRGKQMSEYVASSIPPLHQRSVILDFNSPNLSSQFHAETILRLIFSKNNN